MKIRTVIISVSVIFFFASASYSQSSSRNYFLEWSTWTLIQAIPSPVFYQDRNKTGSRLQFGLRWHITPLNYSFNANRLVSPVQYFKVNPVRRYGGSMELFLQPEWTTSSFRYSDLDRFGMSGGIRGFIPAVESGEYLSFSAGGKYNFRKNRQKENAGFYSAEAGIYTLFGMIGIVADYNFTKSSRYNISLNIKYY